MISNQAGPDVGGLDDSPSLVSGPKRLQLTSWQKVGVAGLITFVFLTFIWVDHALQAKSTDKAAELTVDANARAFRPAPLLPVQEPAQPPAQSKSGGPNEVSPAESPLFAYTANPTGSQASPIGTVLAGQAPGQIVPPLAPNPNDSSNAIAGRLKPTPTLLSKAALLPHPDMLITKGTIIPCTLQTAINTELAGFVKCVLPEAVRSTTGNVVLLDRGTTVIGEIQTGLSQGQKRVFILWNRAETPQHAIISLMSPGADELGRAGVDGTVNNHFWDRFGSALMLSVVDGALQAGTAFAGSSGRGSGTYFNNFQSNGQQVTDTTLQRSINIPPTLEKKQGENVSIFVANDIDFSAVYQLDLVK